MNRRIVAAAAACAGLAAVVSSSSLAAGFGAVAEILSARCTVCHSGEAAPRGLRLDDHASLLRGSDRGPVVVPGDPAGSEIVRRVKGLSQPRMPMTGPPWLEDAQVASIESWIAAGAPAGAETGKAAAPARRRPGPGEPVRWADVEPVFLQRCVKCHADDGAMGPPPEGRRLGTRADVLAWGDRAVVVPGSTGASELVRRIRGQALPRMPFDGPPWLPDDDARLVADWVAQGAPDDGGNRAPVPVGARVRLHGTMGRGYSLDGMPLRMESGGRIETARGYVRVLGTVEADGGVRASEIRSRRPEGPGAPAGQGVRVEDRPPIRVDDDHHGGEVEDDHGGRRRGRGRDDRR